MRIALPVGDPFGIGPEVALAALALLSEERLARIDLFGPRALFLRLAARSGDPAWANAARLAAIPVDLPDPPAPSPATPTAAGGAASLAYLDAAIASLRAGRTHALATGPVSKEAWALAGTPIGGQTEYLARACGVTPDRVEMLFLGESFHVILATRHLPLSAVPRALTAGRLTDAALVGIRALRRLGFAPPCVSFLALNPHASDGGLLGAEEAEVFRPALVATAAALASEFPGIAVDGPHPADGLFAMPPADGRLVVAPYHDLGLVPFKMAHPRRGINWTVGLPWPRFSVDHGTAFAIAGTGRADPGAMAHVLDRLFAALDRAAADAD